MSKVGKPRTLKPEQVAEIREWHKLRASIPSTRELAKKFGVTPTTILTAAKDSYAENRCREKCRLMGIKYVPPSREAQP